MKKPASKTGQLSAREQEIAEAFSNGENYQQIADRLCIAPSTVRTHLSTVYRKLGVTSKLELHRFFENNTRIAQRTGDQHPQIHDNPQ